MNTLRVLLLVCVVLVVGCGKKRVAPAGEQKVEFSGKTASFHDWSKISPCDVEPKTLGGDLDSMSALLIEYLGQTSASVEGVWSDEQVAMLEDAGIRLGPALGATEKALAGAAKCKFDKKDALGEPIKKATELVGQARRRIADGPALATALKERAALKAWKDKQPELRTTAKSEWCPPKLKANVTPDIYFATENDAGLTEWLFCDDSKVSATVGNPPVFEAAAALKKKPKEKGYLESAAKYPASDIQRAPKVGGKAAAPAASTDKPARDAIDAAADEANKP